MADLERDREVALLKGTVLFVEDDECIRRVVGAQLLDDGFRFIPADRGAEGLELALRENPSVVLLDLRLPDGSGLDVVRNLRLRNCRVPVVVVTSFG
ncbi:MAG: response regulator receiver protein, partial [bacterium]